MECGVTAWPRPGGGEGLRLRAPRIRDVQGGSAPLSSLDVPRGLGPGAGAGCPVSRGGSARRREHVLCAQRPTGQTRWRARAGRARGQLAGGGRAKGPSAHGRAPGPAVTGVSGPRHPRTPRLQTRLPARPSSSRHPPCELRGRRGRAERRDLGSRSRLRLDEGPLASLVVQLIL